jgi:hypothetical protein
LQFQKKKLSNLKQFKRKREINIGTFIFLIVLIYLGAACIMYASKKQVSVYEVREGSIQKDITYMGLILREELVVYAEETGYINYFQNEQSKVRSGAKAYVMTANALKNDTEFLAVSGELSSELQSSMIHTIQSFNDNYRSAKFSTVYTLKNELKNRLEEATSQSKKDKVSSWLAAYNGSSTTYSMVKDGILSFSYDGYESLTASELSASHFDSSTYETIRREDNEQIQRGEFAYKLITNEAWSILIPFQEEQVEEFKDLTYVKTRINQDTNTLWAEFSIIEQDGAYYAKLDFSEAMIRYIGERFVNVELIRENQSGLKIPKSAVVEKEFYVIPQEYLEYEGESYAEIQILKKNGEIISDYIPVYKTSADGMAYVNPADLEKGTTLISQEGIGTYTASEMGILKGVYNMNQGYTVFQQITILCESDEYYIVKEGETYGLSNYDHIVQNADVVSEDEHIF